MRPTVMEVDKKEFKNNIKKIKKYVGDKEILPVIKANGYGTYINKQLDIINDFNIVGVAIVDEGLDIRKTGYKKDILILNQPDILEIDEIIENDLIIGLSSVEFLKELVKRKENIKVHLEIETGMNRTGIKLEKLDRIYNLINNSSIEIEGVYTHLSSADDDINYTNKQIEVFKKALNIINKPLKYIHVSASNGILNLKLDFTNLVRPGIIIYGYAPFKDALINTNIKPITKLVTRITFIEERNENDAISYNKTYKCDSKKIVATIPIGYGDGLRRSLSNKGFVYINNKKANIIGNICMDSCMIDITNIDAKIEDEVIIWDDNTKLDEIANICNTINYEILCNISERVPRIFNEK